MNVVTRASNGSISYQQLYADLSPDTGDAVSYYYPGTFGHVVAAGRGWRG
jgi:hypothetical protein